ncbi:hypothetical protein [Hyphomicrobium sp.]|uniref:hypothetical protein n=1 Tax=Hyphomicrobium sp. TaxID=82 RepID=UPI001D1BCA76|nr:hypothetical protein [Hyphomicrobium sp.]MBY0561530.1 hypothetical protein [Hyphomicrobium sp.]
MGNSVGYWDSCSGCTDSVDGYISHRLFPIHPKHHVHVGSGCDECKGKGIVFHPFTKADAKAFEEWAREECKR